MSNSTKGPAGQGKGKELKDKLSRDGKQLPILGNYDKMANFNYFKHFVFDIDSRRLNSTQISNKELEEPYELGWAEQCHYINDLEINDQSINKLELYIKEHAITK